MSNSKKKKKKIESLSDVDKPMTLSEVNKNLKGLADLDKPMTLADVKINKGLADIDIERYADAYDTIKSFAVVAKELESNVKLVEYGFGSIKNTFRDMERISFPETIPLTFKSNWERERNALLNRIDDLENQLRLEQESKQELQQMIERSKEQLKKEPKYIT